MIQKECVCVEKSGHEHMRSALGRTEKIGRHCRKSMYNDIWGSQGSEDVNVGLWSHNAMWTYRQTPTFHFSCKDEDSTFLQNIGSYLQVHMVLQLIRPHQQCMMTMQNFKLKPNFVFVKY